MIAKSPKLIEVDVPSSISKLNAGFESISLPAESKQLAKTAPENERQGPSLTAATNKGK